MAVFRPFAAYRPKAELADQVAALPYDVMNRKEAKEAVVGNPYSFLHVDKAEIDLEDSIDSYAACVYEQAASNLKDMIQKSIYEKDDKPCYYIYREMMGERSQTGLVGCASIDDYLENKIKKHELTVAKKEEDRVRHVDTCNANTGPIFLTYRHDSEITAVIEGWKDTHEPEYDFLSDDQVRHTVWVVDDEIVTGILESALSAVSDFYIADGHHRAASAVRVGQKRRQQHPDYTGKEEFNYFLSVLFPDDELAIFDYNRVLKEWNGYTPETLLTRLSADFVITEAGSKPVRPDALHTFGMYMDGRWYHLQAKEQLCQNGCAVDNLDVSILQKYVLTPVFDIQDPRTDPKIAFVGGIRGLEELEKMVDGGMAVAFSMYPTSMEELMEIADGGQIMPPKSTWFEPKLRSGLFIHQL